MKIPLLCLKKLRSHEKLIFISVIAGFTEILQFCQKVEGRVLTAPSLNLGERIQNYENII